MKQVFVLIACVVIAFTACKEERTSYKIKGEVTGLENGFVVKLVNAETSEIIDSAVVKNEMFHFEGKVERAHSAMLITRYNTSFILENAQYKIQEGETPSYVEGGKINSLVYGYELEEGYQKILSENYKKLQEAPEIDMMDKEAMEAARKAFEESSKRIGDYIINYQNKILEGDYPTITKLYILSGAFDVKKYDANKKLELLKEYEKDLGKHSYLVQVRNEISKGMELAEKRKMVAPGKQFKEVVALTPTGKELKLSEVVAKNKYTLLEMWASWCGPCRGEFPYLKKAYSHYRKKGFEIYALSIDEKEKNWLKAMEQENVPWINVVDYDGFKSKATKDYAVQGIPASFLIGQDGKIVATGFDIRGFGLDEKLKELFGE